MKNKIIVSLLCVSIVGSILTGCGNTTTNTNVTEQTTENVENNDEKENAEVVELTEDNIKSMFKNFIDSDNHSYIVTQDGENFKNPTVVKSVKNKEVIYNHCENDLGTFDVYQTEDCIYSYVHFTKFGLKAMYIEDEDFDYENASMDEIMEEVYKIDGIDKSSFVDCEIKEDGIDFYNYAVVNNDNVLETSIIDAYFSEIPETIHTITIEDIRNNDNATNVDIKMSSNSPYVKYKLDDGTVIGLCPGESFIYNGKTYEFDRNGKITCDGVELVKSDYTNSYTLILNDDNSKIEKLIYDEVGSTTIIESSDIEGISIPQEIREKAIESDSLSTYMIISILMSYDPDCVVNTNTVAMRGGSNITETESNIVENEESSN